KLNHALRAEQQFTADAAHELRTPLAAIQMKLQLLQRRHADVLRPLNAEFEQLKLDVKRSTSIMESLLLLARLDPTAEESLPKQAFKIFPFLEELVGSIQVQIEA